MKTLIGEIIEDSRITKRSEMTYGSNSDFFIALVSISHDLDIEIPVWTLREDRMLERKHEVILPLDGHAFLKISTA